MGSRWRSEEIQAAEGWSTGAVLAMRRIKVGVGIGLGLDLGEPS